MDYKGFQITEEMRPEGFLWCVRIGGELIWADDTIEGCKDEIDAMGVSVRPGEDIEDEVIISDNGGEHFHAYWLGDGWEVHGEPLESSPWCEVRTLSEFLSRLSPKAMANR